MNERVGGREGGRENSERERESGSGGGSKRQGERGDTQRKEKSLGKWREFRGSELED